MKTETKLTHLGRDPGAHLGIVNPPVYHTSTILFPNLAALEQAQKGTYPHSSYGRYGTASTRAFERALAELEGADGALVTPSGLGAISTALFALVDHGQHILVPDNVYDSTRRFCQNALSRFGIETEMYDPMIGADIAKLIRPNTALVFVETPGSITFEIQDIPAIAAAAHKAGILVVADNTWSSPLLFRPYEHGVDVSLYSASKYLCGHSDVMMGVVTATKEVFPKLRRMQESLGNLPGPDDIYLVQRGMRTLAARMQMHQAGALEVAKWLSTRPEVARVLHPAFESCPGHAIWKRDFLGSNGLFGVLLHPTSHESLTAMLDGMRLFKMGYSWGGYESLILPFQPKNQRTATAWTHEGPCLRLHIGLEAVPDLIADLEEGFARLKA